MANETVNQEVTQNADVEPQKTFTQDEVNGIVAERLSRDRQKFADYETLKQKAAEFDKMQEENKSELQKATERADSLEKELTALKKANEVQAIRQKISKATGVPTELLTAETEDDCLAQAQAINAYAQQGWRVISCATADIPGFGAARQEFITVLEREI